MERLRKNDADAGIVERPLTETQKIAIAEVRTIHQAKIAEQEILHQSRLRQQPTRRTGVSEAGFRRDRERLAAERDAKREDPPTRLVIEPCDMIA
jgi:hypothetical protein